jgi:hypothetical protein
LSRTGRGELFVIVYVFFTIYYPHSNDIFLADFIDPARHAKFSPYENWLKTNVDTLSADFPYGDKLLHCSEKFFRRNRNFNEKYRQMTKAVKHFF